MSLLVEYRDAREAEDLAQIRRLLVLRAMVATGLSQRRIAESLDISQSAVSQQLQSAKKLDQLPVKTLVSAAAPVLDVLASKYGYRRLAAFGSVARGEARTDSDVDLLVEAPAGTSSFDFLKFEHLLEQVLGRPVDLVEYGGLNPDLDADILRESVLL